ncbi:hypothetical protein I656_00997 [Geobacillus sp. WSUCF1]|nr:hypothetical protein I656_00997 [Geobacillus sp. WSUCF1]
MQIVKLQIASIQMEGRLLTRLIPLIVAMADGKERPMV